LILFPHQISALRQVRDARKAGHRRIVLVSPTGSGKTVMLSVATRQAVDQGKRVVWCVNRRELVTQSAATLERFGLSVGHSGQNLSAPVQVLTYQGAVARGDVPPAEVLVLDECHHVAEKNEWNAIPTAYPEAVILGATATPERGDGHGLDHLFDTLIVAAHSSQLVNVWRATGGKSGLVPVEVIRPSRPIEDGIARTPAKATLVHKLRDHQQVVFAPHIKAANDFAEQFRECGISVAVITGAMPSDERDRALLAFRKREIRALVNVHVLTEGWDAPEVEVVTLARRFRTIGAMIQATGRGARPSPGKDRFIVLDLCGVTHVLGHPYADREYSLEGQGIRGASEAVRLRLCGRCKSEMPEEGPCERCGWVRPPPETPKETGDKLDRWAFLQGDDLETRVGRMTRWAREADRGDKRKALVSAIMRFTAVYGRPPKEIIGQANAALLGRAWCPKCQHSVRAEGCKCTAAA
jgi:superfamily II DNA or RNA helicase